jgi:hypothetical protein
MTVELRRVVSPVADDCDDRGGEVLYQAESPNHGATSLSAVISVYRMALRLAMMREKVRFESLHLSRR